MSNQEAIINNLNHSQTTKTNNKHITTKRIALSVTFDKTASNYFGDYSEININNEELFFRVDVKI